MTDTPEVVVSNTPTALPKSTTPDDLLKMYDEEVVDAKEEIQSEAEKQVKIKEEVPKIEAAKALAKAVKDSTDEVTETNKEESQKEEESEEPKKSLKAKHGDKELDIPEEATFTVKINNKDVQFKLKDAVQAFQGKEEFNRNMDRRVQTVTAKEKEFQRQMGSLKNMATEVINAAISGDIFAVTKQLSKLASGSTNLDPSQFEKLYLDQIEKFNSVYSTMTKDQRDKFFADRRIKFQEDELKRLKENEVRTQTQAQLAEKLQQIWKQNSVSQEDFWDTYKDITDGLVGPDKRFKDKNDITPEDVIAQITLQRNYEKIMEAAEEVGLTDESYFDDILGAVQQNPTWEVKDVAKLIQDADKLAKEQGKPGILNKVSKEVENLNKKAEKSKIKAQFNSVSSTEKKNGKIDGLDKEDLDFLYRNQPKVYKPLFVSK